MQTIISILMPQKQNLNKARLFKHNSFSKTHKIFPALLSIIKDFPHIINLNGSIFTIHDQTLFLRKMCAICLHLFTKEQLYNCLRFIRIKPDIHFFKNITNSIATPMKFKCRNVHTVNFLLQIEGKQRQNAKLSNNLKQTLSNIMDQLKHKNYAIPELLQKIYFLGNLNRQIFYKTSQCVQVPQMQEQRQGDCQQWLQEIDDQQLHPRSMCHLHIERE